MVFLESIFSFSVVNCVQEAQRTLPKKRRIRSWYRDYSIFLLGLAPVYFSNQRPLSLVLLFLVLVPTPLPPLVRHVAATVLLIPSFQRTTPSHSLHRPHVTIIYSTLTVRRYLNWSLVRPSLVLLYPNLTVASDMFQICNLFPFPGLFYLIGGVRIKVIRNGSPLCAIA